VKNGETEKVTFPNPDGRDLAGLLELPEEGKLITFALFAHCFTCSKDIAAASRISRYLRRSGIAVLRFDFTGIGSSKGDFSDTNFSSNIEDIISAADFLRREFQAPGVLIGHSLGGAAVIAAATKIPEVRAVATIGAPSDPTHIDHFFREDIEKICKEGEACFNIGGRQFKIKKQFIEDISKQNLDEHLSRFNRALLVFHSPQDEIVGIEHARNIFEKAKHPKSFVSLDNADHLLKKRVDSEYVASVLSSWATRYINNGPSS